MASHTPTRTFPRSSQNALGSKGSAWKPPLGQLQVVTPDDLYSSRKDFTDTDAATKCLADKVAQGTVKYRYYILEGLKEAPRGISMLFSGKYNGKLCVIICLVRVCGLLIGGIIDERVVKVAH